MSTPLHTKQVVDKYSHLTRVTRVKVASGWLYRADHGRSISVAFAPDDGITGRRVQCTVNSTTGVVVRVDLAMPGNGEEWGYYALIRRDDGTLAEEFVVNLRVVEDGEGGAA